MGRSSVRTVAVVTLAALFTGTATASFGAVPEEVTPPAPIVSPTGQYIVVLDDAPVARYSGGTAGLAPTTPQKGKKFDAHTPAAKKYSAYLKGNQKKAADAVGVTPIATYDTALNGFSATMTPEQAAELQNTPGVKAVYPDEILHPTAVPSTEFLGLSGQGGVWEQVGGTDAAGAGVVVGVIDTGISPENPAFAGDALGTTAGAEPYIEAGEVVFDKADGTQFRSPVGTTADWTADDYSTKLIGARYFSEGAAASGFDFQYDYLSPRDGDGHGSHTASTAAGNLDTPASVEGIDFGTISGVAPAAKVAAYKACYAGPDVLVTDDDTCSGVDLVAAIDAATEDGVDVINFSIGGGAATSVWDAFDDAFLGAAAAGVFVSVSAGNDGPGASTADHASPWYTTVAASTIPTYEGTVQWNGQQAAGVSVTVPFGGSVQGEVVYAGDVAAAGADPAQAALCFLDTLDAAKVAGKIVVCDRGTNARVQKSQTVDEAGGIGMVLVNVTAGSLDNDFHSVPTVHIDAKHRTALLDFVRGTSGATLSLVSGNTTGVETPTPVIAGFSSRGPMLADGSDVLKPDLTAPGVAILAAEHNGPDAEPTFGFKSGTSMSSPHVAGLGALYLGERPDATPAEIKSALMTTAYDSKNGDGSTSTDVFAQGAGHVDPEKFFDAGLLYLNDVDDWAAYLEGVFQTDLTEDAEPIDPSDLNLASIAIGTLAKEQTVTRTVTATTAGTYTASVEGVPGLDVAVSPSEFTIAAGASQQFTVTFTPTSETAVEAWSTGSLTWTSGDTAVRSPLAVYPVTADAPTEVTGTGTSGSAKVTILSGVNGDLPLNVSGLTPFTQLYDRSVKAGGHSGNENSGAADGGTTYFVVDVPAGTTVSRFDLDAATEADGADLDLFVYKIKSKQDWTATSVTQSATEAADEQVTLFTPTPGTYLVRVDVFSVPADGKLPWDLRYANVAAAKPSLVATPNPLSVTQGVNAEYTLSWSKLRANTRYLGLVQYGDSAVRTVVTVDAGARG
ncbi:S8 family serine peptidase [Microbacterium ureisolvens]|uniref:S8 family serine peptidase n=1 Tax=Microbacterium ureisolvens TaxID=2781186 RepID=A0ABS7HYU2_9MICO|nr:S8 family serine peptidase [Microbacterium ureisolvens]MBW9109771.1 S8 family serine peptidase [Microbacterium ureisolvens]